MSSEVHALLRIDLKDSLTSVAMTNIEIIESDFIIHTLGRLYASHA